MHNIFQNLQTIVIYYIFTIKIHYVHIIILHNTNILMKEFSTNTNIVITNSTCSITDISILQYCTEAYSIKSTEREHSIPVSFNNKRKYPRITDKEITHVSLTPHHQLGNQQVHSYLRRIQRSNVNVVDHIEYIHD